MIDEVIDIQTLEDAIIAFKEGASDEKRMALYSLEVMLERKTQMLEEIEKQAA